MNRLSDLPNVGPVLEYNLIKVGIKTPEQLRDYSSIEIFKKIRVLDPSACLHMLYGIEGAIQNVKDAALPIDVKNKLKELYNNFNE